MVELEEAINWEIRKGKERNLIGDVNGGSGWHGRALSLAVQCRDSAVLQVLKASFDCTMDSELFNCWPPPNTIHTNTHKHTQRVFHISKVHDMLLLITLFSFALLL